jgi:hypothetical protein
MEDSTIEGRGERTRSRECLTLIQSAHINIYRENTFRVTGRPVDASEKDIKKHAEKLKLIAEGYGQNANQAAYSLDPAPSVDHIREAIQRIKEPEQRLIDEFFWFWPQEFGKSGNDPAIKAILSGDPDTAYQVWVDLEDDPAYNYIAWHNIAVMFHLVALDWTLFHISSEVDEERELKIKGYWKESFQRWEKIATDDRVWDGVKDRIRSFDDPRLTTGFARRMRGSFPEALDKINAEVALRFAEQGRTDWAKIHIDFMNETHQGLDDVEKTAELVLTPTRNRVLQHIKVAKDEYTKKPELGKDAAIKLIEQCTSLQDLFELFHGSDSYHKTELFDEVAATILNCMVAYQIKTKHNESFVALLKESLNFATGIDVRQRIQKNIDIGEGNIRIKAFDPIFKLLKEIQQSKDTATIRLNNFTSILMPKFRTLAEQNADQREMLDDLYDNLTVVLRGISIDAHNNENNLEISLKAIELAAKLAKSAELKKRVQEDRRQVQESYSERKNNEVNLKIRGDEVEINHRIFRYNQTILKISEITGVRFGVFAQYTNGIRTSVSFLIGVNGDAGILNIECKRFWRSEDQAEADYKTILNGIFYNVLPHLVDRIAQSISSGQILKMGDMRIAQDGIHMHSGAFLWKTEHLVPWNDIRYGTDQGILTVRSANDKRITSSASLRDVWNAAIFELIVKKLMESKLRRYKKI